MVFPHDDAIQRNLDNTMAWYIVEIATNLEHLNEASTTWSIEKKQQLLNNIALKCFIICSRLFNLDHLNPNEAPKLCATLNAILSTRLLDKMGRKLLLASDDVTERQLQNMSALVNNCFVGAYDLDDMIMLVAMRNQIEPLMVPALVASLRADLLLILQDLLADMPAMAG